MQDRIRRFDALDNFRDFGGYGAGERRLATGRLFRSAHHARLSEADVERLAALELSVVVDLRRPSERREQPSRRGPACRARVIESALDDGEEAPHIAFLRNGDLTVEAGRAFMGELYASLPFDPAYVDLFTRYFEALAEADGPVLIHCAAGKDRTGLLAALTHRMAGVHADDVMADYLLTNTAVDLERRAPAIARQLEAMTGRAASHEAVVAFLGVEPAYLDAAFQAIEARHGGVEAYLEQALGVGAGRRDAILERLAA